MKPPYIRIIATCSNHGQFQLDRKPNKRKDPPRGREGMYDAVKCPKCPYWATINHQVLVTINPASPDTDQNLIYTLPGMEA